MFSVDSTQAYEYKAHCFIACASDLKIPPGEAPETIETTMGSKLPFRYQYTDDNGALVYMQDLGCIVLKVAND